MHEAQLHGDQNAFITLTYDREHLPANYSISVREWQLFMKKLRDRLSGRKIRFYACGEYGDQKLRPHYHAIIFGYDFPDKKIFKTENGNTLYTSEQLTSTWGLGHCTTGDVTFESAAYVARYVMKKITGEQAVDHYTRIHPHTGEAHTVTPEFTVMSRRPGIGAPWLLKYRRDVYPSDQVITRGMVTRPPRFYDNQLTEEEVEQIKRRRKKEGLVHKPNQTPARLRARAEIRDQRIQSLKRKLPEDDQ